ncbi:transporter substrate-binding domain-containing protein [Parasutterella secunda]|uniref:Transporter substrate-binding domain-containing protein n=1 Tax=Parasutterella secunda TaxID=626947 RepID=A0ABS2GW89_9BURK|nr:transporter substrate-binding domain-containing protein [Parasutterella secunda]MBM6929112.1 transporter substrate-binding domain-containing protein [Parasutterella secunda]
MLNRRVFQISLAAAIVGACVGLSGCGDKSSADTTPAATSSSQDLLDQIRAKGTIVIATEGTWSPWTFHDEKGNLTGYDIELGRLIAKHLGVKPQFVEGKWDGLLAGISSGRYDIMINGVDITPEREKAFSFTEPYAYNKTVVVTRTSDTAIQSMQDLKGKVTANTISSTYAEVAERYGAKVTGVDDLNQTFELLLSGRIDATLNAEVVFYDYKRVHPTAEVKIAAVSDEMTSVGIPLKKEGTEKLRQEINKALAELHQSGELSKLSQQFFGTDISKK